jgi:hypothetical protein
MTEGPRLCSWPNMEDDYESEKMNSYEKKQKQSWIENFNTVVALFHRQNARRESMRPTQSMTRDKADTLQNSYVIGQHELDFVLDIEIKTKRALGQPLYNMFMRAVANEQTEILPEYMRESLGRLWKEYGLTMDGSYAKLYYAARQQQDRALYIQVSGRPQTALPNLDQQEGSNGFNDRFNDRDYDSN